MRRYGLIGYPLTHSFSKKYFAEKFQREGITEAAYELYALKQISELPQLIDSTPDLEGLNVTIPYKQSVFQYIHSRDNLPTGLDACNCIKIRNGKTYAFNTDVVGFEKSFAAARKPHHKRALILGNGGATAAVAFVLKKLDISFQIVSRMIHDESTLTYDDLNETLIKSHNVIINTTPLGMYPSIESCPPIPYQHLTSQHYLFDLVYNPEKTLFLKKGEEQGASIKNGLEMLIIQAEESWKIWTASQ
jgi:shikimate dehydrogenase